jgi:hypothetical protein
MKKILKFILAVTITTIIITTAISSQEPIKTYSVTVDNIDVVIEHQGMPQNKLDMSVNESLGIETEPIITPFGLACLFGHSITSGTKTETSHNVYSTNPRCVRRVYSISACTRSDCDYYSSTLISENSIACH